MNADELKQLVLDSFAAERDSDTEKGLSLIHPDFKITEMRLGENDQPFSSMSGDALIQQLQAAFAITTRQYKFVHMAADVDTQTVMIEFVESYLDESTGQYYRTPIVAVCEIKDGKIFRNRTYGDDRLSHLHLDQATIDEALS